MNRNFDKARILSLLVTLFFVGVVGSILLTVALFAFYAKDLPRPDKVRRMEGISTVITDRNDIVLYDVYSDQNRIPVEFSDMPKTLREATIAIEDKDFYKHQGFDFRGMLRAVKNMLLRQGLQSGSTLTQQLVKNVLLTQERSLPRKIKEFILSLQIEKKYSKDQILQMYLNEAPYGGPYWGVESASQAYFGKHAKDLDLIESAILAGLPQRPSYYSPFSSNPRAYVPRTTDVLRRMREDGYISKNQESEALEKLAQVKFTDSGGNFKAPHFVIYVRSLLEEKFGEKMVEGGGLRVKTTLDFEIQEEAQKIVAEEIEKAKSLKIGNGAAMVIDPKNGEILAMVGSYDYNAPDYDGNVNVVMSLRQPGSSIKPVTYASALVKGYPTSYLLMDTETVFPVTGQKDYVPVNYDGKFHGPTQIRYALGNSLNIPAVKMLAKVGLKDMLSTAYEMGFTSLEPTTLNMQKFGLSVTLGGGDVRLFDLVSAYSAFANGGQKAEPVAILKVTDSSGKKTLFEHKDPSSKKKVLDEGVAFIISNILSDNNARLITFGANSQLNIPGHTVAVKTGTTDDKRDNWAIGWNPSYVVGVWVGNNDNSPMLKVASGVSGATPIWNRIFKAILKDKSNEEFKKPDSVSEVEVDSLTGTKAYGDGPKRKEFFIKGSEPENPSTVYKKIKVSKATGKIANFVEIATNNYEEKEFVVFTETDPVSTDGKNRWQEGIQKFLDSDPVYKDSKYHPPTETSSGAEDKVSVLIKEPKNETRYDDHDVDVWGEAFSNKEIKKLELYVDGNLKKAIDGNSYHEKINLDTGAHKVKFKGIDSDGRVGESDEVKIGVGVNWDFVPPTPEPLATPTPVPTSTPNP